MRLKSGAQLSYCSNVHPGETWPEVRALLRRDVTAVKALVSPDAPFGVGLRLAAAAAETLDRDPSALADLQSLLAAEDLYVFTVNGFPYGRFHGARVKEAVYRPDWREPARAAYTLQLARVLAALVPEGTMGSISTAPGCFQGRATPGAPAEMAARMHEVAQALADLEHTTGRRIVLALEPEPACFLETTADAVAFFRDYLYAGPHARTTRRFIGLCLDTCHAAVEHERPEDTVAALRAAAIPIFKIQLSAGLEVSRLDPATLAALAPFAEGVYLHQTVARHADGRLTRYVDLPEALAAARAAPAPGVVWRVHFHVPVFARESAIPGLLHTQPFLETILGMHAEQPLTTHLEVETYTWDVLPAAYRDAPLPELIARELRWVRERLRS